MLLAVISLAVAVNVEVELKSACITPRSLLPVAEQEKVDVKSDEIILTDWTVAKRLEVVVRLAKSSVILSLTTTSKPWTCKFAFPWAVSLILVFFLNLPYWFPFLNSLAFCLSSLISSLYPDLSLILFP